jgi:hypothetical protein
MSGTAEGFQAANMRADESLGVASDALDLFVAAQKCQRRSYLPVTGPAIGDLWDMFNFRS